MEFIYLKKLITPAGNVITWKAKLTIYGVEYAECIENKEMYLLSELKEYIEPPDEDEA